MLRYGEEFLSKKFSAGSMKEAYMKAVKWYATNVLAKDELQGVLVEYVKGQDKQSPTVTAHLYVSMIEEEVRNAHCEVCRETHHSFFMSEETNCAWCKVAGYQRRCDDRIRVKKDYYRRILTESEW